MVSVNCIFTQQFGGFAAAMRIENSIKKNIVTLQNTCMYLVVAKDMLYIAYIVLYLGAFAIINIPCSVLFVPVSKSNNHI